METYRVNLSNPYGKKSKYQPYFYIIFGILYTILGILKYMSSYSDYLSSGIWTITGIGFIIVGFISKNTFSKNVLELNDKAIFAHPSFNKNIKIDWNDLEQIKINPVSFDFILKNGSTESISLGNLTYKDVIETKEKLKEFAQHHKVKIN